MMIRDEPGRQSRLARGLCAVLIGLVGLLVALGLSWHMPLGVSEAAGLEKLRDGAQLHLDWQGPWYHQMLGLAQSGQAVLTLWTGTLLAQLLSGLPLLWALRLPDILAVTLIAFTMVRRSPMLATALWQVLLLLLWPLAWLLWLGPPGLAVNAAAAVWLVQALGQSQRRPAWHELLLMSLAVLVLMLNGVGLLVVAALWGSYLHAGLSQGNWRLFDNIRLTGLAALLTAGLTLVDVLSWPDPSRWLTVYMQARQLLAQEGMSERMIGLSLAFGGVPTIMALANSIMKPGRSSRRLLFVLLASGLIFMSAPDMPGASLALLLPIVIMWWATPLLDKEGAVRGLGRLAGALYGLYGLLLAVAVLLISRNLLLYVDWSAYLVLGIWLLMAGLTSWQLWRCYDQQQVNPAGLAWPGWFGLACVLGYTLMGEPIVWPQRVYHQYLVQAAPGWQGKPMAALRPVDTDFWRTALRRPLQAAPNLKALRQWNNRHAARSRVALVRPADADKILSELAGSRPVAQAPGTAQTSVMAIELRAANKDETGS